MCHIGVRSIPDQAHRRSTMFLVGPVRQIKMMCNPTRLIATIIFLLAIAFTLVAALVLHAGLLVLVAVVIQFCALIWYGLSYIPFGRTLMKNACAGCCSSITDV
eukprot:TRINITY_DN3113_c0_g1_i9.p1 TRINITY_DN3113_c0_g1~~TRINITY_DN3113_c0_g1_i9.p1  ORF type:complete len:104 (-),score=5.22 TRINITY_DN3113_c0_g1_i9:218-529(-)